MKKIILYFTSFIMLNSCYYNDEYYYDDYYEKNTNLSGDISHIDDFYFSTPVALSVIDKEITNDTLFYKVGDTLKLFLSFNNRYQETVTDIYNLFKSTSSTKFEYSLNFSNHFDRDIINLTILDQYPELSNSSKEDIITSPYYNDLYLNSYYIPAGLTEDKSYYESKIGLVITNSQLENDYFHLGTSRYISSGGNYYDDITINIPIYSKINDDIVITIEE